MKQCTNCGQSVADEVSFCPNCGQKTGAAPGNSGAAPDAFSAQANQFVDKVQNLNNTSDMTGEFSNQDIQQNKVLAVFSYLALLVLIPIFAAKDSKFARFHANQGLVLLIVEIALSVVMQILTWIILAISWRLYFIISILWLLWIPLWILSILGIVNVLNGRAKQLPVIGHFRILK